MDGPTLMKNHADSSAVKKLPSVSRPVFEEGEGDKSAREPLHSSAKRRVWYSSYRKKKLELIHLVSDRSEPSVCHISNKLIRRIFYRQQSRSVTA